MNGKRLWFSASPYMITIIDRMEGETGLKGANNIQFLILRASVDFLENKAELICLSILNHVFGLNEVSFGSIVSKLVDLRDFGDISESDYELVSLLQVRFLHRVRYALFEKVGIDPLLDYKGTRNPDMNEHVDCIQHESQEKIQEDLRRLGRVSVIAETKGFVPKKGKISGAEFIEKYLQAFAMINAEVNPEGVAIRAKNTTRAARILFKDTK